MVGSCCRAASGPCSLALPAVRVGLPSDSRFVVPSRDMCGMASGQLDASSGIVWGSEIRFGVVTCVLP